MLGVQPGTAELDRVLYGDNVAAIALAHGTGNASWRTRHLRIRSSYLREALDGVAPGGTWKLLHVKGVDLVADGLTKPLHGQAFRAFIEELGMPNQTQPEQEHPQQEGGTSSHAAVVAMMTGSLLLSGADAGEETGDDTETNVLWSDFDGTGRFLRQSASIQGSAMLPTKPARALMGPRQVGGG